MEDAAELLREYAQRFPHSNEPYLNLGVIEMRLGNFEQASVHLERAYAKSSSRSLALLNLAYLAERQKSWGQARQRYESFLIDRPNHFMARMGLARVFWRLGDRKQGMEQLDQARSLAKSASDRAQVELMTKVIRTD